MVVTVCSAKFYVTCASTASVWGSQNVMSMARYSTMAAHSSVRACSRRAAISPNRSLCVRWWMPTRLDPVRAHQDGEVTVHMQCCNRRPSTHGTSDDLRAIRTPLEMALPLLEARVKESHPPARYGVLAMRLITLGTVTQRTG